MNPSLYWPDESLPLAIYCAPGVLKGLDTLATDGLLAIPRTGLGVGGLLLGRQSGKRLEITKSVPISCSHAMGPSFVLTAEELAEAKASEDGVDEDCRLVGWYCSKPNGRMVLSESDKALFDALCGERGQVALLIGPKLGYATVATFALRGDGRNGDRFQLGKQAELVAPEKIVDPEEPEFAPVDGLPAVEAAPEPVVPDKPVEEPVIESPKVAAERPAIPFMPRGGTLFGAEDPYAERKRRWRRRLVITIILVAALAVVAYLTRGYWPESGISK